MTSRALILLFSIASLAFFKLNGQTTDSPSFQTNDPTFKTLRQRAKEAVAKGEKTLRLAASLDFGPVPQSMEDAFRIASVVKAVPIAVRTIISDEGLITLYKVRILERLNPPPYEDVETLARAPKQIRESGLLPLGDDEILVFLLGGETTIEGIKVIQTDPDEPLLTLNKSYLLFLTESSDGLARFLINSGGVFEIIDGDKLRPMVKKDTAIVVLAKEFYANSLKALTRSVIVSQKP